MKLILHEIIKNIKIILRDKTSLVLLLLGPIIIIIITGYMFGNETFHGLKIGIYLDKKTPLASELITNVEKLGEIKYFKLKGKCLDELRKERVHLCLLIKHPEIATEKTQGKVTIYSNISGSKVWAEGIVPEIRFLIDASSYEISIRSVESFLETIAKLAERLNQRKENINLFTEELSNLSNTFHQEQQALAQIRATSQKRYEQIKNFENSLNSELSDVEETIDAINSLTNELKDSLSQVSIIQIPSNSSDEDETFFDLFTGLPVFQETSESPPIIENTLRLKESITVIEGLEQENTTLIQNFQELRDDFQTTSQALAELNTLLQSELITSNNTLQKIDNALNLLNEINQDLEQDLYTITGFSPEDAQRLVKPIYQEHFSLASFRTIEQLFGMILAMLLTFISIIFATIIALEEINSKAHFRNIISPTSKNVLLFGAVATNIILVTVQVITFLIVAQWQFKINVFVDFWQLYGVSLMLVIIFTFLGISLGYLIKRPQIAILIAIFCSFGLFLFSNAFYPLELMPELGAKIAIFNPVGLVEQLTRILILHGVPIWEYKKELSYLMIDLLIALLLAVIAKKHYLKNLR